MMKFRPIEYQKKAPTHLPQIVYHFCSTNLGILMKMTIMIITNVFVVCCSYQPVHCVFTNITIIIQEQ